MTLVRRVQRFDRALNASATLARLVTRFRTRAAVQRSAMPQAILLLESGAVTAKQLPDSYSYFLTRTLAGSRFASAQGSTSSLETSTKHGAHNLRRLMPRLSS